MAESPTPRIISETEASRLTSLSRTQHWRLELEGKFPRRVTLGARRHGYVEAEILAWVQERISARQQVAA